MTDLTKIKKRFDKRAEKGYYVFPEEEWKWIEKEIKKAEERGEKKGMTETMNLTAKVLEKYET